MSAKYIYNSLNLPPDLDKLSIDDFREYAEWKCALRMIGEQHGFEWTLDDASNKSNSDPIRSKDEEITAQLKAKAVIEELVDKEVLTKLLPNLQNPKTTAAEALRHLDDHFEPNTPFALGPVWNSLDDLFTRRSKMDPVVFLEKLEKALNNFTALGSSMGDADKIMMVYGCFMRFYPEWAEDTRIELTRKDKEKWPSFPAFVYSLKTSLLKEGYGKSSAGGVTTTSQSEKKKKKKKKSKAKKPSQVSSGRNPETPNPEEQVSDDQNQQPDIPKIVGLVGGATEILSGFTVPGVASNNIPLSSDSRWMIDSMTSFHMTPNLDILSNYQPVHSKSAVKGISGLLEVKGYGTVRIQTSLGRTISLENVGYVPGLAYNLLALGKLCDVGLNPRLVEGELVDSEGRIVGGITRDIGVYFLEGRALLPVVNSGIDGLSQRLIFV